MLIILGSRNMLKRQALALACEDAGTEAMIETIEAQSRVSSQPVGWDETWRGARNRALQARDASPSAYGIGIENGIRKNAAGSWEDFALGTLIDPHGNMLLSESSAVLLPEGAVALAQARGFTHTTVGSILAELHGCHPQDPHSWLTDGKTSRLNLLRDMLRTLLIRPS